MNVFFIDPQSASNLALYDYSLLNNMRGHNITFFCRDIFEYKFTERNIILKNVFCYYNKSNFFTKTLSYIITIFSIIKLLFVNSPAIVHIQWIKIWFIDFLFVIICKLKGIKVVFTAHNIIPHNHHIYDKLLYKIYYRTIDAIIVHSNRTKNELSGLCNLSPNKIHVIFHGVLYDSYDMKEISRRVSELRMKYDIAADDIVYSCLGCQNKYKGIDLVVQVWANEYALNKNKKLHIIFAGKNENIDFSVIKNLDNVVIINDRISEIDFKALLFMTSVVLLPYRTISQSGVLFSALNYSIPVLVTDVGGLAEPLSFGNIGWNIGKCSYDNIKSFLLKLSSNSNIISEIKNNFVDFERVKVIYSWEKIGLQTSSLYDTLK